MTAPPTPAHTGHLTAKLSTLDRYLRGVDPCRHGPWIGAGTTHPRAGPGAGFLQGRGVSLPIALGLLLMMYPVLAKVRYNETGRITADKRLMITSLVMNWLLGPAVMFALAWMFLPDLPEYRTGLIIVGLARCIAMVLIWNDLACGDREMAAVLVAHQRGVPGPRLRRAGLVLPPGAARLAGPADHQLQSPSGRSPLTVLVFLGIPLVAGFLTRTLGERAKGRDWYENTVPAQDRPVGPLRAAVHHRHPVRPAGRYHHLRAAGRRPHRVAAACLLPGGLRRIHAHWPGPGPGLRAHHDTWPSPRPATTSNWPLRWPSPPSG